MCNFCSRLELTHFYCAVLRIILQFLTEINIFTHFLVEYKS